MTKQEPVLEILIDTGDDKPVSADVAAEVLRQTVKILEAIESSMTGEPPKIEWLLTGVRTVDTTSVSAEKAD